MQHATPHQFHIPVMGTGFTIDTPLRVARWGISSAISLVDDALIEQVRGFHADRIGVAWTPIGSREEDARARRITAYLDLMHDEVERQIDELRGGSFEPGSQIDRYFSMLPDGELRRSYLGLSQLSAPARATAEQHLRAAIVPGAIEANIMTKIDRRRGAKGEERPSEDSDALAALRGFALSKGPSALVFSAGLNPRLYAYAATFDGFMPDARGQLRKRIVLKVSDFRSASIQGRYLAKRGLWVSEFRLESGLNCGGHAFATPGLLMGPILDEFRRQREALAQQLFSDWATALSAAGHRVPDAPPTLRVTAQGGLGTSDEASLLHERYGVDGTGWGTPFLLVPEVTRVDADTRARLLAAGPEQIHRGPTSPLGVPFWSLTTSASEQARQQRIDSGRPGSACPKGYLALDESGEGPPQCLASRSYQGARQRAPAGADAPPADYLAKACICHDLAGSALIELGIERKATPAICPGPNIVNFEHTMDLAQIVEHVYGRAAIELRPGRRHVFIAELDLYLDELESRVSAIPVDASPRERKDVDRFHGNLEAAIEHYWAVVPHLPASSRAEFEAGLRRGATRLRGLAIPTDERASA